LPGQRTTSFTATVWLCQSHYVILFVRALTRQLCNRHKSRDPEACAASGLQVALSLVLNWLIGPALMTGLAWATLPDLEGYRNGVILVRACRHFMLYTTCGDNSACSLEQRHVGGEHNGMSAAGCCCVPAMVLEALLLRCVCADGNTMTAGGPGALHRHGAAVEPAGAGPRRILRGAGRHQLHHADRAVQPPGHLLHQGAYASDEPVAMVGINIRHSIVNARSPS
jgi:Sodium Bile acid symporter family